MSLHIREDLGKCQSLSHLCGTWQVNEWVASTGEVHVGQFRFSKWGKGVGSGSPSRKGVEGSSAKKLAALKKWVGYQRGEGSPAWPSILWQKIAKMGGLVRRKLHLPLPLHHPTPQPPIKYSNCSVMPEGARISGRVCLVPGRPQGLLEVCKRISRAFPLPPNTQKKLFLAHPTLVFIQNKACN